MKKLLLLLSSVFITVIALAQSKTFKTNELHYANCPSPAEDFYFTWDQTTGKVTDFYWNHGGEKWFLYTATPIESTVLKNDPIAIYDYNVHLFVTTAKYKTTAYQIRAKLTLTAMRPNGATFGGVYEGTGTYWIAANGNFK